MENVTKDITKRPYEKPDIVVVELDESPRLLAASDGIKNHHGEMD